MLRFARCATKALLMIRAGMKHRQDPGINKRDTQKGYHARFEKLVTHSLNLYPQQVPFKSGHPATAPKIIMCLKIMHRSLLTLRIFEDFSPLTVPRLYATIGHYWYLFKRLTVVSAGRFYRFEHIVSYSSGKVVGK